MLLHSVKMDHVIQVINESAAAEGVTDVSMLNFVVSDGCSMVRASYMQIFF